MAGSISRRRFLASSIAGAGGALLASPALASRSRRRRQDLYFQLVTAGRDVSGPRLRRDAIRQRVRILVGAPGESSNSLVYVDDGGSMLVDAATPPMGRRMIVDASLVGGPFGMPDGVAAVVVSTHHHADHTGGNHALASLGPRPELLMHKRTDERVRAMLGRFMEAALGGVRAAAQIEDPSRRAMALDSAVWFAERSGGMSEADFAASQTHETPEHEISIGQATVVLHHFGPGHTDNDLVVHLPDENVVHCGDLLFSRMHPFFAEDSGSTCRGWIASVGRIIELCDDDTVVVPGHGPVCGVGELRRQRAYLERLWDAVRAEIARGTPREQAVRMSWPFMDGLEREALRPRAIGAVYDEALASG